MKASVLDWIRKIRGSNELKINAKNENRYIVLISENDTSTSAYCFSAPVYNYKTKKLVDLDFHYGKRVLEGSNNTTSIHKNKIEMQNPQGVLCVMMEDNLICGDTEKVVIGKAAIRKVELYPTLNGLLFKMKNTQQGITFRMSIDDPFLKVRANSKYFALMRQDSRPFVTASPIGVTDISRNVISPAFVAYRRIDDINYEVSIKALEPNGKNLEFEINLYEPKLVHDTTVESKNPAESNPYGGTAFLGKSGAFGEQWLYTRIDLTKLLSLRDKTVKRVRYFLPDLSGKTSGLTAYQTVQRFCSFGSNWKNKAAHTQNNNESTEVNGYICLDITKFMVNPKTRLLKQSEGLIIRKKETGCTAVATGDNYHTPQVLEINFGGESHN